MKVKVRVRFVAYSPPMSFSTCHHINLMIIFDYIDFLKMPFPKPRCPERPSVPGISPISDYDFIFSKPHLPSALVITKSFPIVLT